MNTRSWYSKSDMFTWCLTLPFINNHHRKYAIHFKVMLHLDSCLRAMDLWTEPIFVACDQCTDTLQNKWSALKTQIFENQLAYACDPTPIHNEFCFHCYLTPSDNFYNGPIRCDRAGARSHYFARISFHMTFVWILCSFWARAAWKRNVDGSMPCYLKQTDYYVCYYCLQFWNLHSVFGICGIYYAKWFRHYTGNEMCTWANCNFLAMSCDAIDILFC